jgi:hypothetical protein
VIEHIVDEFYEVYECHSGSLVTLYDNRILPYLIIKTMDFPHCSDCLQLENIALGHPTTIYSRLNGVNNCCEMPQSSEVQERAQVWCSGNVSVTHYSLQNRLSQHVILIIQQPQWKKMTMITRKIVQLMKIVHVPGSLYASTAPDLCPLLDFTLESENPVLNRVVQQVTLPEWFVIFLVKKVSDSVFNQLESARCQTE